MVGYWKSRGLWTQCCWAWNSALVKVTRRQQRFLNPLRNLPSQLLPQESPSVLPADHRSSTSSTTSTSTLSTTSWTTTSTTSSSSSSSSSTTSSSSSTSHTTFDVAPAQLEGCIGCLGTDGFLLFWMRLSLGLESQYQYAWGCFQQQKTGTPYLDTHKFLPGTQETVLHKLVGLLAKNDSGPK